MKKADVSPKRKRELEPTEDQLRIENKQLRSRIATANQNLDALKKSPVFRDNESDLKTPAEQEVASLRKEVGTLHNLLRVAQIETKALDPKQH